MFLLGSGWWEGWEQAGGCHVRITCLDAFRDACGLIVLFCALNVLTNFKSKLQTDSIVKCTNEAMMDAAVIYALGLLVASS